MTSKPLFKTRDLVRNLTTLYNLKKSARVPPGNEGYVVDRAYDLENGGHRVKVRFLIKDQTVDCWVSERAVERC